jgi:hypothetical protein
MQASALSGLSHVVALTGNGLKCLVEDRHAYETAIHKNHEEILTAE